MEDKGIMEEKKQSTIKKECFYILFSEKGKFIGFFDNLDSLKIVQENNPNSLFNEINEDIKAELISLGSILIDIDKITSDTIIDSLDYFIIKPQLEIDIDSIKEVLSNHIKEDAGKYIVKGLVITLPSTNEAKEFTYKIEDQINLKEIVDNYTSGDYVFYHAKGETNDILYLYEDLKYVYKELYNNKIYNLIYSTVLVNWIKDNYTEEMYNNKENVIIYGFSNDEIKEKVENLYEQQKIS